MSEEKDLLLEEWLGVLAELWTAAGKALEADRLQVPEFAGGGTAGSAGAGVFGDSYRRNSRRRRVAVSARGSLWPPRPGLG